MYNILKSYSLVKWFGIIFIILGLLLLSAVAESTHVPLIQCVVFIIMSLLICGVGVGCLLWDEPVDTFKDL